METITEHTELEFKYKSDTVQLQDFMTFVQQFDIIKRKDVSSYDYYYTKIANPNEFIRYRESDKSELTIKRKTNTNNNWNRTEVDLPLDSSRITKSTIETWATLEGYKFNFSVFKTCFIMWIGNINIVYYIVYDNNMIELNRFIEIEYNKESVAKVGEEQAFKEIKEFEQKLSTLGISPQNRLKRSLFELYKKE